MEKPKLYLFVMVGKKIYKFWKSREIKGEIKCITIKKDKIGDWYVYIVCNMENVEEEKIPKSISKTGKTAGFDFGCMTFLTQNNGNKIQSPQFFKQSKKKITKANRKLSKKTKGSNNYNNAKRSLAKLHKKIGNQRRDFHFKLANELCSKHDKMFFETLDIQSMKKRHGKKINDLGFSDFMKILESKALEHNKSIHYIDKWFASTKTCNECGYKNDELNERIRTWICPECGKEHDRDTNAAMNIIRKGVEESANKSNVISKISVGASTGWREDVSLGECQAVLARA